MTQFKAVVTEDIPANRFLTRVVDENGVTLIVTPTGQKPDYRSTGFLTGGQEVTVTITNNPTWVVEAAESIAVGENVAVGDGGQAVKATGGNEVGYAVTAAAEAGDTIVIVKTCGDEGGGGGDVIPSPLTPGVVLGTTLETNTLGMVGYSQSPMGDKLAMYNFGGQVKTAVPADDNDAATKKYVDDKTYDAAAITSGTFSVARIPNLAQSKITNLTTDLAAKLTAQQAAAQADSTATDITGVVADLNALLAKLRAAGIMASS